MVSGSGAGATQRAIWLNMIDAISCETVAFFSLVRLHLHNGDGTVAPMSQWPLFTEDMMGVGVGHASLGHQCGRWAMTDALTTLKNDLR
jgi:hypothetical protein